MIKHLQIVLKGSFRHSGFRFHALQAAHTFSICGMVAERDGTIVIDAEGDESMLEEFVKWCRAGDRIPTPESIQVAEKPLSYFSDFLIL